MPLTRMNMKRRDMMKKTALGVASIGIGAPAAHAVKKEDIPPKPLPENREMEYRTLGKTGIKVSRLGFGSHLSKENLKDGKRRDRQIQEGFENGINLFDVYDHGSYHQFKPMSKSLAGKRDKVVISLVAVEDDIRNEVEGALRKFRTDNIDLYRVVYRDNEDVQYNRGEKELEMLFDLKGEGKIRAVGVVSHHEVGILHALEHYPIDYIMIPMNFHHNMAWFRDKPDTYSKILPICREKGVGILTIKPMGGDPLVAYAQHIGLLSPDHKGPSYPKAAMRHLWRNDDIASVIPSMNTVGELWDSLESFWQPEMSKDEMKVLKNLTKKADKTLGAYLPEHYRWMEEWRVRQA